MELAALSSRIDWPATAFLLIGLLLGYLAFVLIGLRRPRVTEPPAAPAQSMPDAQVRERMRLLEEALDEVRSELAALRQEITGLKAARAVAPQYGEAMTLAGRGESAQQIAGSCGISIAEAELVQALTRESNAAGRLDG